MNASDTLKKGNVALSCEEEVLITTQGCVDSRVAVKRWIDAKEADGLVVGRAMTGGGQCWREELVVI